MKKDFIDAVNNSNKFSPTLYITLDDIEIDGKIVLWVHIPVASQVVRCNGRIWDRGEDGDHDITDAIIAVGELYERKSGQFTERKVFPYASEDDLRLDELMPRVRIMADTKMPDIRGKIWATWRSCGAPDCMKTIRIPKKRDSILQGFCCLGQMRRF